MPRNSLNLHTNREWMRKRYLRDRATVEQMAAEAGVSTVIIYKMIKQMGLKR